MIEGDRTWLASMLDHVPELIKAVTEAYDGITVEAFAPAVREFFDTARHPVLGVPYTKIAFRPMRELITLLQASGVRGLYLLSGRPGLRPGGVAGDVRHPPAARDRLGHHAGVPARRGVPHQGHRAAGR